MGAPVRTDGARCGASKTHPPPIGARSPFQRAPGAPRLSSWLHSSGLRPASAGGAGCPGCGRLLQPPGMGTAPQNCPSAAYSTASQPLPPPKGCTIGHIAPPPTGSRAGARRGRLGARTARKVRTSTAARPPQGCRAAVLASQGAHRLLWLLRRWPLRWPLLRRLAGGTAAGGRCTRAFPRGRGPTSTAARPPQGCRTAVLASQCAHRLLWLLRRRPLRWPLLRWPASGTAAGGRCTRAFPRGRRRATRAQAPTLLLHGTHRHTAAENRRCCARSARDLVLLRLDPAIPRVYL